MSTTEETGSGPVEEYEAYSDYDLVSRRVTAAVHSAVEAYSRAMQDQTSGVKVATFERVRRRAAILEAATILQAELDAITTTGRVGKVARDWSGRDGHVEKLRRTDRLARPDWVGEFVGQIRFIARELGYLKTGKTVTVADETDEFAEVEAVLEEMVA